MIHTPIIVITNDGKIKEFNSNQIGNARLYIEENGGEIFWRDDWYQSKIYQINKLQDKFLTWIAGKTGVKMTDPFTPTGLIGRSGQWYSCEPYDHIKSMIKHDDAPYIELKSGLAMFDAFYTVERVRPNRAQFEMLMNWCTEANKRFEDVVSGYWAECWKNFT